MTFHGPYRGLTASNAGHAPTPLRHDDHGQDDRPRRSRSVEGSLHELPLVMLLPLGVLALGARLPARSPIPSSATGAADFWNGSVCVPGARIQANCRSGSNWAALRRPSSVSRWPITITSCIPICRASSRRARLLYLFLYNKWYFDELYDFLFVNPAFFVGRFLWKKGDGMLIDGLAPTAFPRGYWMSPAARSRLQSAMSIIMPWRCSWASW